MEHWVKQMFPFAFEIISLEVLSFFFGGFPTVIYVTLLKRL
jgi:hypothetical protein